MIELRILREDSDRVRASQRARGEDATLVDRLLRADNARRSAIAAFETLRGEQKSLGRDVARAQGAEKQALLSRTRDLSIEVKSADAAAITFSVPAPT